MMNTADRLTPFGRAREVRVLGTDLLVPPYNIGPGATPNDERTLLECG